jgi:hypothetical protein
MIELEQARRPIRTTNDSIHDELIRRCATGDPIAAQMIAAEAFAKANAAKRNETR